MPAFRCSLPPQRGPLSWRAAIAALPAHVQQAAACIVWWDMFGARRSADRWSELDEWVMADLQEEPNDEDLARALMSLGYPARSIRARLARVRAIPQPQMRQRAGGYRQHTTLRRLLMPLAS